MWFVNTDAMAVEEENLLVDIVETSALGAIDSAGNRVKKLGVMRLDKDKNRFIVSLSKSEKKALARQQKQNASANPVKPLRSVPRKRAATGSSGTPAKKRPRPARTMVREETPEEPEPVLMLEAPAPFRTEERQGSVGSPGGMSGTHISGGTQYAESSAVRESSESPNEEEQRTAYRNRVIPGNRQEGFFHVNNLANYGSLLGFVPGIDFMGVVDELIAPGDIEKMQGKSIQENAEFVVRDMFRSMASLRAIANQSESQVAAIKTLREEYKVLEAEHKEQGSQLEAERTKNAELQGKVEKIEKEIQQVRMDTAKRVSKLCDVNLKQDKELKALKEEKRTLQQEHEAYVKDLIHRNAEEVKKAIEFTWHNCLHQMRFVYGGLSVKQLDMNRCIKDGVLKPITNPVDPNIFDRSYPTDDEEEDVLEEDKSNEEQLDYGSSDNEEGFVEEPNEDEEQGEPTVGGEVPDLGGFDSEDAEDEVPAVREPVKKSVRFVEPVVAGDESAKAGGSQKENETNPKPMDKGFSEPTKPVEKSQLTSKASDPKPKVSSEPTGIKQPTNEAKVVEPKVVDPKGVKEASGSQKPKQQKTTIPAKVVDPKASKQPSGSQTPMSIATSKPQEITKVVEVVQGSKAIVRIQKRTEEKAAEPKQVKDEPKEGTK
jgi:hypothetical protein